MQSTIETLSRAVARTQAKGGTLSLIWLADGVVAVCSLQFYINILSQPPSRYKGEIGFFDFYIIPLAKKLETCGVFGVSKDEYLKFASDNRKEWELKGRELVAQYRKECQEKFQSYSAKDQTAPVDISQATSMEAVTVGGETNFDKCSWC